MENKLKKLLNNSYSPYYKFNVSCVLITKDNKEFYGINVENIAGINICAERNAIYNAITNGCKKGDFKEINIMVNSNECSLPCFTCRQVMLEFFDDDVIINCYNKNNDCNTYTLKELCPYPFKSEDLR